MFVPYSTKVQIKPKFIVNPLLLKPELTKEGEVLAVGENVKKVAKGDKVFYHPDNNCIHDNSFWIDQEYIFAKR